MNNKPSSNSSDKSPVDNKQFLLRYASLGTQLLVALGLAVFIGLKTDKWLHVSPLLACVLPLLTLTGIFYKLMRETSRKRPPDKTTKDEK
jgi:F0F1-type ATP synthase assembly protein I